jgi:hypothetical protein
MVGHIQCFLDKMILLIKSSHTRSFVFKVQPKLIKNIIKISCYKVLIHVFRLSFVPRYGFGW